MASVLRQALVITSLCFLIVFGFVSGEGGDQSSSDSGTNSTANTTSCSNSTSDSNTTCSNATSNSTTTTTESGDSSGTTSSSDSTTGAGATSGSSTTENGATSGSSTTEGGGSSGDSTTGDGATSSSSTTGDGATSSSSTTGDGATSGSSTTTSSGDTSDSSGSTSSSSGSTTSSGGTTSTNSETSSSSGTGSTSDTTSGSTGTNTGTSSGSGSSSSTGDSTSTGSGGSSGSTDTTSSGGTTVPSKTSVTETARARVKADKTSINGTGLLIYVIKDSLESATDYTDPSGAKYKNFESAGSRLNTKLKDVADIGDNIKGTLGFKKMTRLSPSSAQGEYFAEVSGTLTYPLVSDFLDGLNQEEVFKDTGLKYKLVFPPVPEPYRWHNLYFKLKSPFVNDYRNPESEQNVKFRRDIQTMLFDQLARKVPVVRQVLVMSLLPGSIDVQTAVETNEYSNSNTTQMLGSALQDVKNIGDYVVDANEDTKSAVSAQYIDGMQKLELVSKDKLPAVKVPTRDDEDIKEGEISLVDKKKGLPKPKDYFLTVTIPSFVAILLFIILFLCFTTTANRMLNEGAADKDHP